MLALLQSATAAVLAVALVALAPPTARQRPGTTALLVLLGVLLALVASGLGLPFPRALVVTGFAALPPLVGRYAQRALRPDGGPRLEVHIGIGLVALAVALVTGPAVRVGVLTGLGMGYVGWIARLWRRSAKPADAGAFLGVFGLHWVLSAASGIAATAGAPNALAAAFETGSLLGLGLFAGVAAALGLRRLPALAPPPPAPYADGLDDPDRQWLAERLRALVAGERPHLDPDLTAAALADRLGASPRELSEVLTVAFGSSFYDFVNSLRVDEAKALLADPDRADATVLEILYEAGFNSKSAFHRAFKARVGVTPSAYRRACAAPRENGAERGDGALESDPLPVLGRHTGSTG